MIIIPESKRWRPELEKARAAGESQIYQDPGITMEGRMSRYWENTPRVEKFMDVLNLLVGGGEGMAVRAEQKALSLAESRVAKEGASFIAESELSKGMKEILKKRRIFNKLSNRGSGDFRLAFGRGIQAKQEYSRLLSEARAGNPTAIERVNSITAMRREYVDKAMDEAKVMADFYGEVPVGLEYRVARLGTNAPKDVYGVFDPTTWEADVAIGINRDIADIVNSVAHEVVGHGTSTYLTQGGAKPGTSLYMLKDAWNRLHIAARALRRESEPMLLSLSEHDPLELTAIKRIKNQRRLMYKASPEEVFADTIEFHMGSGADFRTAVKESIKDVYSLIYNSVNELQKAKEALGLSTEIPFTK